MNRHEDLEDRTLRFAKDILALCQRLPTEIALNEVKKQLMKAGGSVAANYHEANEAVSRKDFLLHVRIARKEAKEARMWLQVVPEYERTMEEQRRLIQEASELLFIFTAIIKKSE
jgi:four helix bundle protein